MAEKTSIGWTDGGSTWNPTAGCSPQSDGCRNCYAAREAIRLAGNPNPKVHSVYEGLSEMRGTGKNRRAVFTGKVRTARERLEIPLRWKKGRMIFVDSMSDLFHDEVPTHFIAEVFAVMAEARQHIFQILTKNAVRMRMLMSSDDFWTLVSLHGVEKWWKMDTMLLDDDRRFLPHVWLGVSCENQDNVHRIVHLVETPAATRFVSLEPLLGIINLRSLPLQKIHQLIPGGESDPNPRECRWNWILDLIRQGQAAGCAVFVKQLGSNSINFIGNRATFPDKKAEDWDHWPEVLRVREFPTPYDQREGVQCST